MIEMLLTLHIPMTEEQYEALRARARRRGYEDVATYLLVLAAQDPEEDDIDAEFAIERILEDFKQAWHDAMTGNLLPLSALDQLLDDE
jgi:hypothetical protein